MINFKVAAIIEILVEVLIGVIVEKGLKEIGMSGDMIVVRGEVIVGIHVTTVGKYLIIERFKLVVEVALGPSGWPRSTSRDS